MSIHEHEREFGKWADFQHNPMRDGTPLAHPDVDLQNARRDKIMHWVWSACDSIDFGSMDVIRQGRKVCEIVEGALNRQSLRVHGVCAALLAKLSKDGLIVDHSDEKELIKELLSEHLNVTGEAPLNPDSSPVGRGPVDHLAPSGKCTCGLRLTAFKGHAENCPLHLADQVTPKAKCPLGKCGGRGWYWMGGNDYQKICECRSSPSTAAGAAKDFGRTGSH